VSGEDAKGLNWIMMQGGMTDNYISSDEVLLLWKLWT
jgi:hypothetical protein